MTCFTKSRIEIQIPLLDPSYQIQTHSPWFQNQKRYAADKKIYNLSLGVMSLIGFAGGLFGYACVRSLKEVSFKEGVGVLAIALGTALACLGMLLASSDLTFVPNLNNLKSLQRLCGEMQTLRLETFNAKEKSHKNTFQACLNYGLLDILVYHEMEVLLKEFRIHQNLCGHQPLHPKAIELNLRWERLQNDIKSQLPYLIDSV